jgi:predicted nucleic acid-binding protein
LILYLDTSAFIKLYVDEPNADRVRAAVTEADQIHTHWIAYPEIRAALARLYRMVRQDAETFDQCKRAFERDWDMITSVLPDERILRRAGELAERFGLSGYDSMHLAAAESLRVGQGADSLRFACFDARLNQSAEELGLRLLA